MIPVESIRVGDYLMVRGEGDPFYGEKVKVLEHPFFTCTRNGNMHLVKVENDESRIGYVDAGKMESPV